MRTITRLALAGLGGAAAGAAGAAAALAVIGAAHAAAIRPAVPPSRTPAPNLTRCAATNYAGHRCGLLDTPRGHRHIYVPVQREPAVSEAYEGARAVAERARTAFRTFREGADQGCTECGVPHSSTEPHAEPAPPMPPAPPTVEALEDDPRGDSQLYRGDAEKTFDVEQAAAERVDEH